MFEFKDDSLTVVRLFYMVLKGEMMEHKRVILNKCLTFCALKWKCLKGPRKGQILDSNTFAQRMKELFIVFHRQKLFMIINVILMLMVSSTEWFLVCGPIKKRRTIL